MSKANWLKQKNIKHSLILGALVIAVLGGCKKDEPDPIDLGYDYFPNIVGTFLEYEVDSTRHIGGDATDYHFYLREEHREQFIDGEGQLAVWIDRFTRPTPSDAWTFVSSYAQKRTSTTAERYEENQRYVRMVFPVNAEQSWNGNAYNDEGPWTHTYQNIGQQYILSPSLIFADAIRVQQRNVFNLIETEMAHEIYVRGVGLVYKDIRDLAFGNSEGYELVYELTAYGDM